MSRMIMGISGRMKKEREREGESRAFVQQLASKPALARSLADWSGILVVACAVLLMLARLRRRKRRKN